MVHPGGFGVDTLSELSENEWYCERSALSGMHADLRGDVFLYGYLKLTEYLKQKLSKKPSIKVESIRQPGGAYLIVITKGDK